jgi:hypothetical protein
MNDDEFVHVDLLVAVTDVLRDLRRRLTVHPECQAVLDQVCDDHGVEIDWSDGDTAGDES